MTDRQDSDFSQGWDPTRIPPPPPQDRTTAPEAVPPAGPPPAGQRPSGQHALGAPSTGQQTVGQHAEDQGTGQHAVGNPWETTPSTDRPEAGAADAVESAADPVEAAGSENGSGPGGMEETTVAVPPTAERTGPTVAYDPQLTTRLPPVPRDTRGPYGAPPRPRPGQPDTGVGPERVAPQPLWGARSSPSQPPPGFAPPGYGVAPGQPQPPRPWGEHTGQHPTRDGWGEIGYRGAGAPGNYDYVDSIRHSDLVPTRKLPPRRGWRKAILTMTFGALNLGRSPDERRQDELEAKARTLLRGRFKIGVLGKGGTGKTTMAASLGSIFAGLRQDDRVVAIDADIAFGKLASRIDPNTAGSYWELAADQHLDSFADVRSRVGSNAAGLFVLGGESATARRRVLDPAMYREATSRLDNHFTISIVDCGSAMDAPVTREVLGDLDALLVVSSPWIDGASAAGQTMEWLANNGYTGLLHRTVVVLNDSDGHADKRTRSLLVERFGSRGQVVVEVPFDPHLRPGGVIDVDSEISPTTRRRLLEIAATIAEHFAATTDGPREHR